MKISAGGFSVGKVNSGCCYYCGAVATSKEHVPARCFFPKERDFRRDLFTVPSCKEHNSAKSNIDQSAFLAIALIAQENTVRTEVGSELIDRLIRTLIRERDDSQAPSHHNIFGRRFPLRVVCRMSSADGFAPRYVTLNEFGTDAVRDYLDSLARALYFRERGKQWEGGVAVVIHRAAFPSFYRERKIIEQYFDIEKGKGSCKEVFAYEYLEALEVSGASCAIVGCFYKAVYFTVFFSLVA
ncbi:hypothetical protein [Paracidovorax citrulli]|uniref:hypothetical protein n=1 Tax=Paracidovorax citrulli TaxID=80869 RepID=UPI003FA7DBDF